MLLTALREGAGEGEGTSSQENVSSSNNSNYIRILRCYVASCPGFVIIIIIITLSQVAIMAQI